MNRVNQVGFEGFAKTLIKKYKIPGFGIGISRSHEPIYLKGFGYRNLEHKLEITPETVFGLGSITKSFTCVAIMQLQERGKLSIHDPISHYLPEFQLKNHNNISGITIHHLMTNSSGIPPLSSRFFAMKRSMDADESLGDFTGLKMDTKDGKPLDSYEELLLYISNLDFKLLGLPGKYFSYSNDGFSLLGLIIERVSGEKYEHYVENNILKPLGMVNSVFYTSDLDNDNITTLYALREKVEESEVYPAPLWWDSPAMLSAGFLKSTVQDMLNYTQMFCNQGRFGKTSILNPESINEMMYPHIEFEPGKFYGYGLMITPNYYGTTLVEHGGNLKGIAAHMCMIPEKSISGIVLTNLAAVPATRIMLSAVNTLIGRTADVSQFDDFEVTKLMANEYIGNYNSDEGMQLSIYKVEEKLMLKTQGTDFSIRSIDKDIFIITIRDQEEKVVFLRDENKVIFGVRFHFRILIKE